MGSSMGQGVSGGCDVTLGRSISAASRVGQAVTSIPGLNPDGTLETLCWCQANVVAVTPAEVRDGKTRQCGPRCELGGEPQRYVYGGTGSRRRVYPSRPPKA